MLCSQNRLDANRQNAQRSTGPRTPEGKSNTALNALKHGLTASPDASPLLPTEHADIYHACQQQLLEELDPRSPLELILAHRIVTLSWRLRRVPAAEAELFSREGDRLRQPVINANRAAQHEYLKPYPGHSRPETPPTPKPLPPDPPAQMTLAKRFDAENPTNPFIRLQRYESALQRDLSRCLKELRTLQQQDPPLPPPPDESPEQNKAIPANPSPTTNDKPQTTHAPHDKSNPPQLPPPFTIHHSSFRMLPPPSSHCAPPSPSIFPPVPYTESFNPNPRGVASDLPDESQRGRTVGDRLNNNGAKPCLS